MRMWPWGVAIGTSPGCWCPRSRCCRRCGGAERRSTGRRARRGCAAAASPGSTSRRARSPRASRPAAPGRSPARPRVSVAARSSARHAGATRRRQRLDTGITAPSRRGRPRPYYNPARAHADAVMLTDTLCTRCGLCCDGTLLGDVELTGPAEAARLELLGLDVDTDDADTELLALPCRGAPWHPVRRLLAAPAVLPDVRMHAAAKRRARHRLGGARARPNRRGAGAGAAGEGAARSVEPRPARLPLEERVADAIAAPPDAHQPRPATGPPLESAMAVLARTIRTTFLD